MNNKLYLKKCITVQAVMHLKMEQREPKKAVEQVGLD